MTKIKTIEFKWDGFDCMYWDFNRLDIDHDGKQGLMYVWVCWLGPFSIRKLRENNE